MYNKKKPKKRTCRQKRQAVQIISRIRDIRNKHEERMARAVEFSGKISSFTRYLAITSLALVWMLVESKIIGLRELLQDVRVQILIILCLLVLLFELVHLLLNVVVNLIYANAKLTKPLSYVKKQKKTEVVATTFPKSVIKIEWWIWGIKVMCLMVAFITFCYLLLDIMFD